MSTSTAPDALLTETLRARGQRVTPQRVAIFRALHELGHHAAAEEVMAHVGDRVPGMSLPTVYATLDLLAELGLVRRVSTDAGPRLFDPRPEAHHHLVCRRCGTVEDLDAPVDVNAALKAARRAGFSPGDAELVVRGLCRRCAG